MNNITFFVNNFVGANMKYPLLLLFIIFLPIQIKIKLKFDYYSIYLYGIKIKSKKYKKNKVKLGNNKDFFINYIKDKIKINFIIGYIYQDNYVSSYIFGILNLVKGILTNVLGEKVKIRLENNNFENSSIEATLSVNIIDMIIRYILYRKRNKNGSSFTSIYRKFFKQYQTNGRCK